MALLLMARMYTVERNKRKEKKKSLEYIAKNACH